MKKKSLPLTLLGGLTVEQFFSEYWHKKPLLIRQAIPGFKPLLSKKELFTLAGRDDVESRLISSFGNHWELSKGPFDRLPVEEPKEWTVLIQGVNLHNEKADALLRQFNFVPSARLDDLMISYAADGGGVGPHFDSYDVFLLQAHGQRRWRIGAQKDLSLIEGMPLKILRNFKPEVEYVLEPGDMLYLPPHYAHDGIAEGECMTYSIGFRTPHYQELAESFLNFKSETVELPGRYADPELAPVTHPAELQDAMIDKVLAEIEKIRFSREDMTLFLGEYLTEPKPSVFFDPPRRPHSQKKFAELAKNNGVKLALKSIMLYQGKHVFINGEAFNVTAKDKTLLAKLADQRALTGAEVCKATPDVLDALCIWYEDGWLVLNK